MKMRIKTAVLKNSSNFNVTEPTPDTTLFASHSYAPF